MKNKPLRTTGDEARKRRGFPGGAKGLFALDNSPVFRYNDYGKL